jgi:hypothetical protein
MCRTHERIGNENENDAQMNRPWTFGRRRDLVSLLGRDVKMSNVFVSVFNVGMKMINKLIVNGFERFVAGLSWERGSV